MIQDEVSRVTQDQEWDTSSHEDFYNYYEQQSISSKALARFKGTCDTLLRIYDSTEATSTLSVLDVGCGAGSQCYFWTSLGHRYQGIDINEPLIKLAQDRAIQNGIDAKFEVGSATELHYKDESIDICLLPELLEHVAEWQACLNEAIRVLRPGGLLYINTSNTLCPIQEEFNLPLYSWYPNVLKRYYEQRAVTDKPQLANYAKYPAVNWFSYYKLNSFLIERGFTSLDRFDLINISGKGKLARAIIHMIRASNLLRFFGQVFTPYTIIVARKLP